MQHAPVPGRLDTLTATCVALLNWLAGAIARMGGARRSRLLRRAVQVAERFVQAILFLRAVGRAPSAPPRPRRPMNAPRGFRRNRLGLRLMLRHARIANRRASFAQRIARLAAVLAAPARYIARFEALLLRGAGAGALVAAAPAAVSWRNANAARSSWANTS